MPPRGETAIMFGSWYTHPIIDRVFEQCDDNALRVALEQINQHERMLRLDGNLIIKLWFHISRNTQRKRLDKKTRFRKSPTAQKFREYSQNYAHFVQVSEQTIRATDTAEAPWHIVEATDKRFRDLRAAEIILASLESRLQRTEPFDIGTARLLNGHHERTLLDALDLDHIVPTREYSKQLAAYQKQLTKLIWRAHEQKRNVICLFEGWDASGKGGAIRRVTSAIDARLYKVISVAAPTDEERAHHYLWRFWRHIPRDGYMTIYDRSWYGRVLVERVEDFATPAEWQRAYHEINTFEQQLTDHGVIVFKFWLHISRDEQLKRFREREETPWKQHKITEEDWRNREKWDDYEQAISDMVTRTSTESSPWTLVAGNDKEHCRIQVLQTLCSGLEKHLLTEK
jgi:polyphosphate:AMP phosphotransferase